MEALVFLGEIPSALLHQQSFLLTLQGNAVDRPSWATDSRIPMKLLLLFEARRAEDGRRVVLRGLGRLTHILKKVFHRLHASSEGPARDGERLAARWIDRTRFRADELAIVLVVASDILAS